jgi:tetratricopeptide (TPR) repeat protein
MKPINEQNRIFGPSGCISEKAISLYLKSELTEKEKNIFEQHISDCLLCSEALDGFEKNADNDNIFTELGSIQNDLKSRFAIPVKKNFKKSGIKRTLITTVSIAASLLIVITGYYFINIQTKTIKHDLSVNNPKPEEKTISEKQINTTLPEDLSKKSVTEKGWFEENLAEEDLTEKGMVDEKTKDVEQNNGQYSFRNTETITKTGETNEKDGDISSNDVGLAGKKSEDQQNIYGGIISGDIVFGATLPDQNQLDSMSLKGNEQKVAQITGQTVADEITSDKSISLEVLEDPKKETDKNYKKVDVTGVAAGAAVSRSEYKPSLTNALSYYNSAKYKEAIPELEVLVAENKNDVAALYFLAMSYYNDGQKDAAIPFLDKIIKKKNNSYYDLALWQKALILTEKNQNKEARELLNEIVKRGGTLRNNAIQQIDELDKSE